MRFPLACGYHALFHDSTLLFSRSSGQLGINIHVLEDSLRRELLTNSEYRRQSVVYLVGLEITQSQLDIFNNQGFLQTIAGEFGEVQFDVLGIDIVPNSGQSQPSIWLRLRATKIGMAENWELFLEKMRKLQSNFGLARIRKIRIMCIPNLKIIIVSHFTRFHRLARDWTQFRARTGRDRTALSLQALAR